MKKIFSILALVLLVVLFYFYFFPKQPKNIFDEIYQETEKNYRTNNILRHIDGFEISPGWPSDGEYSKYYPFGTYNKDHTPEEYFEVEISFNFATKTQLSSISFEKRIGPNVRVRLWNKY
ncbi:TipC family immunity protein, partial [Streptococcus pseudopneumoniae]